jgi:hypothetical protein
MKFPQIESENLHSELRAVLRSSQFLAMVIMADVGVAIWSKALALTA